MECSFGKILAELRRARQLSQRTVAKDLHISQALLSHYENGTREPGLPFVCHACDYFGVSADYLLGRTPEAQGTGDMSSALSELRGALLKTDDISARQAATNFIDAAARRLNALLTGSGDELYIAEQNVKMSGAELYLVRIRQKN